MTDKQKMTAAIAWAAHKALGADSKLIAKGVSVDKQAKRDWLAVEVMGWIGPREIVTTTGFYSYYFSNTANIRPIQRADRWDPFSNIGQAFDLLDKMECSSLQNLLSDRWVASVKYGKNQQGQVFEDKPCDAICYAVLRATGYPGGV